MKEFALLIKGIAGCYSGFNPAFSAQTCFSIIASGKMFWGAEADCKIRSGYLGGFAEIRTTFKRDYLLSQLQSLFSLYSVLIISPDLLIMKLSI